MDVDIERFGITIYRYTGSCIRGSCRVEDLTTYSIHTNYWSSRLCSWIISVCCTGYCYPISGTLKILILKKLTLKNDDFTAVPTTLPSVGDPPVTENDCGGVFVVSGQAVY